ncbi:hypothetical protein L6164_026751 [Bauhinia variegata]|uniref:Uncharacterized protein n=1 Tax=Bauhinia variegata TaxID=167791 RepID=A0ACB9LR49_BAUVA|nr:hypothetical protein L6164_026751 [Bauhinia variegata]
MTCFRRRSGSSFGIVLFFLAAVLLGMAPRSESIRDFKGFKMTLESQLPKGPVPPSGPSLCHNKLSPYKYEHKGSSASFPDDYIICP